MLQSGGPSLPDYARKAVIELAQSKPDFYPMPSWTHLSQLHGPRVSPLLPPSLTLSLTHSCTHYQDLKVWGVEPVVTHQTSWLESTRSLTHSLTHSLARSLTHSLARSLARSPTHPPTHPFTHSLIRTAIASYVDACKLLSQSLIASAGESADWQLASCGTGCYMCHVLCIQRNPQCTPTCTHTTNTWVARTGPHHTYVVPCRLCF